MTAPTSGSNCSPSVTETSISMIFTISYSAGNNISVFGDLFA
jgi:hypothetical protein